MKKPRKPFVHKVYVYHKNYEFPTQHEIDEAIQQKDDQRNLRMLRKLADIIDSPHR